MSPYTILGVASNCSIDIAREAYRKLAMKHHPDRGGDEESFKQAKAAWELIEGGYRDEVAKPKAKPFKSTFTNRAWEQPADPGGTWRDQTMDSIFEELKRANRGAAPSGFTPNYSNGNNEFVAQVSIRDAFLGFNVVVPARGAKDNVLQQNLATIPPGLPHGHRDTYTLTNGGSKTVVVRIEPGKFRLRGLNDQDNLFSAGLEIGDIELDMEVDAIDLITGAWIKTKDFLGEELSVRIPAGFNPLHRLKISGKGYRGWLYNSPTTYRMNMFLRLIPIFKTPENIDPQKIINLYKSLQDHEPSDART